VQPTLKSSTLKNGLKVITAEGNHPTSSLGLFINSGSRFEEPANAGASFFLRNLAFKVRYVQSRISSRSRKRFQQISLIWNICDRGDAEIYVVKRSLNLFTLLSRWIFLEDS
jgi:predicted Zn-dependent peptidase